MNSISRRRMLGDLAAAASAMLVPRIAAAVRTSAARPKNIILVLAQRMGTGDVACYGQGLVSTPHLDALAAAGLRFTDFHACSPAVGPARIGLLTGRYPQRYGAPAAMSVAHRDPDWVFRAQTYLHALPFRSLTVVGDDGRATLETQAVDFIDAHRQLPFCLEMVVAAPVAALDMATGAIVGRIERLGLSDHTVILISSLSAGPDGGDLRGGAGTLWEGGLRVPAIAYCPGFIPRGLFDEPATALDIFPTLLALRGMSHRIQSFDGNDLAPLAAERQRSPERTFVWSYSGSFAVRRGRWKLIFNRSRGEKGLHLFDLAADIRERRDLLAREPEVAETLHGAFHDWRRAMATDAGVVVGHSRVT